MLLLLLSGGNPPRIYYVIGPDAGWVDPNEMEIVAGQLDGGGPATAFGDEEAPTITTAPFDFSAPATGLSGGTAYRIALVWFNGVTYSNVAVSSPFTTSSSGAFFRSRTTHGVRAGSRQAA